jgi:hypothetical protein
MARLREDSGARAYIVGAQDIQVKQGKGALLAVTVNQAATTVSIYDNTGGTGNPIAIIGTGVGTFAHNVKFDNGLHIVTVGAGADVTVSYV